MYGALETNLTKTKIKKVNKNKKNTMTKAHTITETN